MKILKTFIAITLVLLLTSCRTAWHIDKSYDAQGNTTHSSKFYMGNLLSTTTFANVGVDYNGVKFNLSNYNAKGDVEMMSAISEMVVYSIAAYGSMGAYPTTEAIINAFKSGEVAKVVKKVNNNEQVTVEDFPAASASLQSIKK
jgi:hypothetical protein